MLSFYSANTLTYPTATLILPYFTFYGKEDKMDNLDSLK